MLNQLQRLLVTTGTLSAVAMAIATGADASEATRPATTVADWVAQIEAAIVEITDVRFEETEAGLQVVLETADGVLATPVTTTSGDALILEIPNARLVLPDGNELIEFEPAEDIAVVQVTQRAGDRVEVSITGTDAAPLAEVSTDASGLTLGVVPGVAQADEDDEALQLIVTGEEAGSDYFVPNARSTLRTDVDIRDTPSSVTVIPQQVIEDQGATNIRDIVRNAVGVGFFNSSGRDERFLLRGFEAERFRNGIRDVDGAIAVTEADLANIERVEILRGPASVLFGQAEPSGIINFVTKQPQREAAYEVKFTAGSFDFYRPTLDFTGPLTADGSLAYRLNAAYESDGGFRIGSERFFIAPTLSWEIGDDTELTLEFSHLDDSRPLDRGLARAVVDNELLDIPFDTIIGNSDRTDFRETRAELYLDHRFNDNLSLRSGIRYGDSLEAGPNAFVFGGSDPSNLPVGEFISDFQGEVFDIQTDLVAEFDTGAIEHTLLFGLEYTNVFDDASNERRLGGTFDLFNPSPDFGSEGEFELFFDREESTETFGIYLQNQIAIADNLQLVVGGRFDTFDSESNNLLSDEVTTQDGNAFSPRVGLVYRPIDPISLYASYTRSFTPVSGTDVDGESFNPERGTGFEVGVKTEIIPDRLFSTLALYDTTLTNVTTADLDNPGFGIQTGEQRSRGIELDVQGEILPGWNIFAGYAYTDATVTEDNVIPAGNRLSNVPEHAFNLWTKYTVQEGDFAGLGFGVGVFYVDERATNLGNTFFVDDYTRVDAAISYKRDNYRFGLNFQNLFDTQYIEGALGLEPGEPFTVLGTVAVEF